MIPVKERRYFALRFRITSFRASRHGRDYQPRLLVFFSVTAFFTFFVSSLFLEFEARQVPRPFPVVCEEARQRPLFPRAIALSSNVRCSPLSRRLECFYECGKPARKKKEDCWAWFRIGHNATNRNRISKCRVSNSSPPGIDGEAASVASARR